MQQCTQEAGLCGPHGSPHLCAIIFSLGVFFWLNVSPCGIGNYGVQ